MKRPVGSKSNKPVQKSQFWFSIIDGNTREFKDVVTVVAPDIEEAIDLLRKGGWTSDGDVFILTDQIEN